jgi:hypothetical protein
VHHVELWVPDLHRALASLGWLLEALGYTLFQCWDGGRSWRLGPTYLVIEQSPDLSAEQHDRRPGLNHLAPASPQVSTISLTRGCDCLFPSTTPTMRQADSHMVNSCR